jgi:uncharacterized protein (TIRG00374 family)
MSVKNLLIVGVKAGLSLLLLYLLADSMDLATVSETLARLPLGSAAACLVLLISTTLLASLRWRLIMQGIGSPLACSDTLSLTFIGTFFNQVLPTSVGGDAVRIWRTRRLGIGYGNAIGGVFLDRLNGVVGLVLVVALGVWFMGGRIDNAALRHGLLMTLPLTLVCLGFLSFLDRLPAVVRRWRGLEKLGDLASITRRAFFTFPLALKLLALSLLGHVLASLAVFVLAEGLGEPLAFLDSLALLPSVILITMIPLSFAGWGIREGAMVVMFGFAGVTPEVALSLSVLFGIILFASSLPGFVFWLTGRPGSHKLA